jgi:hypothetical protein
MLQLSAVEILRIFSGVCEDLNFLWRNVFDWYVVTDVSEERYESTFRI